MKNIIVTVSVILTSVFIFLLFFFLLKARAIKNSIFMAVEEGKTESPETTAESWQGILHHLESANESEWKLAIIEADKLLDRILVQKGIKGESMAERLSFLTKEKLPSLDLLWEAHKTRNRIVHQAGFRISQTEAKKIISYYQEALRDLEAMTKS